jgi:hypothetical protein
LMRVTTSGGMLGLVGCWSINLGIGASSVMY